MMNTHRLAPGAPGEEAHWSPGQKTGVGTAIGTDSTVWFSIGHGVLNEVYYPQADTPCIRDMGFIITDGRDYFSDEKTETDSSVLWQEPGVPAFTITNTSHDKKYLLTKRVVSDPAQNTVLQNTVFQANDPARRFRIHVLLTPHLGNMGSGNTSWIGEVDGNTVLFSERGGYALALVCSAPLRGCSAGFIGASDGRKNLKINKQLTWEYDRAENGNTALVAEIDSSNAENFTLSLGFGKTPDQAASSALASLRTGFDTIWNEYIHGWKAWQNTHPKLQLGAEYSHALYQASLAVLHTHETKSPAGGVVAGLASPWGTARGDQDKIGYHIVWTRDMVEVAGGLLAAGAHQDLYRMLTFLKNTQQPDGHWPQNMWVDGTPFWNGVQMDETALPILLTVLAWQKQALKAKDIAEFWPMVQAAARYVVQNGPVTQQDRWEEDPGYTPFTVAAEIAALLAAADMAHMQKEDALATYLRQTADIWYESIDEWMYASDTDWCRKYGVDGYYERITSVQKDDVSRLQKSVHIENIPPGQADQSAIHVVSPDVLALVRFGLRDANDPRIINTLKVVDAELKIETPFGPTWHRYNHDGYGERSDGQPFEGVGHGRGWPLLTGERAMYELAAGNKERSNYLKAAMERFANESYLLPEQVWDSKDIAAHELYLGRPAGSATPLAWAHAEYLKLCRSQLDGRIFDMPSQTVERYVKNETTAQYKAWRFNHKIRRISSSRILRVEALAPARIHWSEDEWRTAHNLNTSDTGLGVYIGDMPEVAAGKRILFTFYWPQADRWEGKDFEVLVT